MTNHLEQRIHHGLAQLERAGLGRTLPAISKRSGVAYDLNGVRVVGFCSNDYLGLAHDPRIFGDLAGLGSVGATASRLICGDLPEHRKAEAALAALVDAEDAVLFPSGFQLNTGVLPALLEAEDLVYSDALNHASLIDGLRLSAAKREILPHLQPPPLGSSQPRFWVTESVFSMDGDVAPMAAVSSFMSQGGVVYMDEAHGIGLGPRGGGYAQEAGVQPTVLVGTLGKALGCAGAFVGASATVCKWIRTRARSFVFSTGTSPSLLPSIQAAVKIVSSSQGHELRERLFANIDHMARGLGLPKTAARTPIFPLFVGPNQAAVNLAASLVQRGFHVQAIRPPTVAEGTARLRLTVTAAHTPQQIDNLLEALMRVFLQQGLPLRSKA